MVEQLGLVGEADGPEPPRSPARSCSTSSVVNRGPRKLPCWRVPARRGPGAGPGAGARRTGPPPAPRRRRRPPAGSRGRRTAPRGAAGRWPRSSGRRRRPGPGSSCPVCAWTWRPIRSTTSSVTAWMLAARSMCRCSRGDFGQPRRPAEEPVEAAAGHRQPLAVVEVVHVQPEAAVGLEVDQVARGSAPRRPAGRRGPGPSACIRRC